MKLTMVIADDEQLSLKSQEILIKKEFPNIEIVGLAENGVVLKQMLESAQPDLAIVDIRMPGLTGLEVIALMRNKGCKTHFIIRTAYSDFEYVKTALDLKTDGYLLKPGKREENVEVIARMCKIVEEKSRQERKQKEMQTVLYAVNPAFESEILKSVLMEHVQKEDFCTYCRMHDIKFTKGCIITLLPEAKQNRFGIRELHAKLTEILDGICYFLSTVSEEYLVVMILLPQEIEAEGLKKWCSDIARLIADELGKHAGVDFLYGSGNIYDTFESMPDSYQESLKELKNRRELLEYTDEPADHVNLYIEQTKEYVKLHYKEDISLDDCARNVDISSFYLSHIFREKTGKTFVEYLSGVRISKAKMLCENQSFSIKDIAEQCGYGNITYFYKVFKRATGLTIGDYRREIKHVSSK